MIGLGSLGYLGACSAGGVSPGPASENATAALRMVREGSVPKTLTPENQGFTPQFVDGDDHTPDFVEIGYSLHCGGTRDWFRENGPALALDLREGRKAALFSHIARTEREIPVGIEMMRAGQEHYPEVVYATLGLALHLDRPLFAEEVRQFVDELGFPPAPDFSEEIATVGLLGVARAYRDGLKRRTTPIIITSKVG